MAWGICRGANGGMRAELLWTNPSPTTANDSETKYTMSKDYNNYDFFMLNYRKSVTDSAECFAIFPKETFVKYGSTQSDCLFGLQNGSQNNTRYFGRKPSFANNEFFVSKCYILGTTSTKPEDIIPLKLYGLKGKIGGV